MVSATVGDEDTVVSAPVKKNSATICRVHCKAAEGFHRRASVVSGIDLYMWAATGAGRKYYIVISVGIEVTDENANITWKSRKRHHWII